MVLFHGNFLITLHQDTNRRAHPVTFVNNPVVSPLETEIVA